MTAIARARSRGPRGRVAASPAIALSALRSLKFFFGALSAHFFEFVAEFLPIPRHPAGDLQHFRRPRTVVFSSCRGQMGERRGWKSRGAKKLSRQNCTSPLVFFFFFGFGFAGKGGGCARASIAENRIDRHHVAVGRQAPAAVPGSAEGALKASEAAPEAPCRRGLPAPLVLRPERGRQEDAVSRHAQRGG